MLLETVQPFACPIGEIAQPRALLVKVSFSACANDRKLTVNTCGEFDTPLAVIVTCPTNEPSVKPAVLIPMFVEDGVLPLADETVSHEASLAAVHEIVPAPGFEMVRVWAGGAA